MINSKVSTAYWILRDGLFGPLENRRAIHALNPILIVPQSGAGDQLLSTAAYLQLAQKRKVHLIVKSSHFELVCELLSGSAITLHNADSFGNPKYRNISDRKQFRGLARSLGASILSFSDLQLRIARFARPDINPIAQVYRISRLDASTFSNQLYFSNFLDLFRDEQFLPPNSRYALVDHFPGTEREIPGYILDEIADRGLQVINAPKNETFASLIRLVSNASELHLVNSSMLCWCLIINPNSSLKKIYITQRNFLLGHTLYDDSWNEVALTNAGICELIDRNVELQTAQGKARRITRRLVDALVFGQVNLKLLQIPKHNRKLKNSFMESGKGDNDGE